MNYSKAARVQDLMLELAFYIVSGNSYYRLCFASAEASSSSQCFDLEALKTFSAGTLSLYRETQFHSRVQVYLYRLLSSPDQPPPLHSDPHCSEHLIRSTYFAWITCQVLSILTAVTSSAQYLSSEIADFLSAFVIQLSHFLHGDGNQCLRCSQNSTHSVANPISLSSAGLLERPI